jgi:hypothetical protein
MPARIVFRAHALQRMSERGIMPEDVIMILWTGETIERYPDDTPYPSRLVLGWVRGRALHVVVAENAEQDTLIVVTVYEPDQTRWSADFRRRQP